ncbi:MAG: peptidylprolyl isomerase [Streptosporangiaceae bacterium]|jgi:peptidylprolyl isomerase|nr:peptidylprolyl isomerase [Streptosporangiaceae bacterium]
MSEDDKPAVKAKLPSARDISRKDFTPHGIKSKGGSKPSGLTAADAARRKRAVIAGLVVAVVAVAGGTTFWMTRPEPKIQVRGAFGKEPSVSFKGVKPDPKLKSTKVIPVIKGKGVAVAKGDFAFINASTYVWSAKKNKLLQSTFKSGKPAPLQIGSDQSLPGLTKGLTGAKVGSRVLLEIPPADGLGVQGSPEAGVSGTDTLVFVVDVVGTYNKNSVVSGTPAQADPKLPTVTGGAAGQAPTVTIPKTAAPDTLSATPLIQGTGPVVTKGQTLVMQYHGVLWRNGKVFDSTWQRGEPFITAIGMGKVVPGWDKGLVGQKVGSRVLLVVPPKDGYGSKGQGEIKGTDTMVFVVDVVAAY